MQITGFFSDYLFMAMRQMLDKMEGILKMPSIYAAKNQ